MVGPIEILPPLSPVHAAAAARAIPVEPSDRTGHAGGRPSPRLAPADVVIDVDASGDPQPRPSARAEAGGQRTGQRRARPAQPTPERRAVYGTALAGAADRPSLRETGAIAYRSADGLIADFAHRGTFLDLEV